MKKTILILIYCFLFFVHNSSAQKIRFTDTSNVWYKFENNFNNHKGGILRYSYTGDTIINGVPYKSSQFGYVREDTLTGVVYVKNANAGYYPTSSNIIDTNELVLYNYNLNVGDSIISKIGYNDTAVFIVKTIDSVTIRNILYKVWSMQLKSGATSTFEFSIIEGVGSTCGPWFPVYPYTFENGLKLICFDNNGSSPPVNPKVDNYFDNTTSCQLSVNSVDVKLAVTTITPNPANEYSTINFPYAIQHGWLLIINSMGQVVAEKEIHNREQVKLGSLSTPGMYYYKIIDKQSGNNFYSRFVYQ